MIVLFTDFGLAGPYVGQMKAAVYREFPAALIVDLAHDAPVCNPRASAYGLAAYVSVFPPEAVFLCVVDPGVGDASRRAAAAKIDGRWFVGPDNGLFNVLAMRAGTLEWWDITWMPARLSASFHGRDLFAPVAARLARGDSPPGERVDPAVRLLSGWPDELAEVIYIDHFGNAITGLRAAAVTGENVLRVRGHVLPKARTFSDVAAGQAFWYENANGLVEIAVNQGRADHGLGLHVGDTVQCGRYGGVPPGLWV